jgi:hypothetical protein
MFEDVVRGPGVHRYSDIRAVTVILEIYLITNFDSNLLITDWLGMDKDCDGTVGELSVC